MNMLWADIMLATTTVWGEARGEGATGKLAVACTLVNRWRTQTGQFRKDDTLATAALRHVQFSVWNQGDPNFTKLFQVDFTQPS